MRMAKKSSTQKKIQGLVIFKHKERPKKKKADKYVVEQINKEDKITITNRLTVLGNQFRYSILINNEKSVPITDINIKILYPRNLKFAGSYPLTLNVSCPIEENQNNEGILDLNLTEIKGKNLKQLHFHFIPSTTRGADDYITFLKYINNKGKEREIKSQSIKIKIDDLKISPKIISHSRIREISQIPGMKRALISLGIGTKKNLNLKKVFDIFESLITSYNFQFITKDKEKGILWFYGSETKSNNDILGFSKIGHNIIEVMAYSINPIVLALFLFSFNIKVIDQLKNNKIIKSNMKLIPLECINCGENLPYFPKMGESITCIKCSYEQLVW
jgi:hypothetical protein